jgi:hypothetical protein
MVNRYFIVVYTAGKKETGKPEAFDVPKLKLE